MLWPHALGRWVVDDNDDKDDDQCDVAKGGENLPSDVKEAQTVLRLKLWWTIHEHGVPCARVVNLDGRPCASCRRVGGPHLAVLGV